MKTKWQIACEKGGMNPDILHAELRVSIMEENKDDVKRLIQEEGIPINSFNNLIITICEYHGKKEMLEFLKGLENE